MRKRYIATTLTAFAVVAYLAMDDSDENRPLQVDKQGKAEADYFIENLSAENYNKDGSLSQQIDAARATHYPDTDTTILQEPSIVVHENQAPQWGIRASEGTLRKNQQLNLNGNVLIVPMSKGNTLSLSTESLDVDLSKHIADTNDEVLIESDTTELQAIGMKLDLDAQQAYFKSQVRGKHDPNAN